MTTNAADSPLVSVVIPAHNAAETLREAIDSVLAQTFGNFELLVIDNASDDDTAALVGSYTDPRIRCVSYDRAGVSFARNRGIEEARGRFIAFLDADDRWRPEKLARQLEVFDAQPDTGLVFCWCDSIDESGRFLKRGNYVRLEEPVYEQMIGWNLLENTSSPVIRRDVFARVGGFDESLRLAEDWDVWLRIAFDYPLVCVPEVLADYRVQRDSASLSNIPEMIDATLGVLHTALDRLPSSAQRDRLERGAEANLYQYLAMRIVETCQTRSAGFTALGYGWRALVRQPLRLSQWWRSLRLGLACLAVIVLPPSTWHRLRRRWSARLR